MLEYDATVQQRCEQIAREPDILQRFASDIARIGVVGDPQILKAIYLIITSRLLPKPVSLLVKGPSSAGKSHAVEQVTKFFPSEAVYSLTGMSDKVLAHDKTPIAHRMLLIYEACGLKGQGAEYMLRSLISEGRIKYSVVVSQGGGGCDVTHRERKGPTGVIMTTTEIAIKIDNENRMLTLTVNDEPKHTGDIMRALGRRYAGELQEVECDWEAWHLLQKRITNIDNRVVIPYAHAVAEKVPTANLRLRRDFTLFMSLVQAHTLLHQASRKRAADGSLIAAPEDYIKVRDLVGPAMQEMLEVRVPDRICETVAAVRKLTTQGPPTTTGAVAAHLGIDKAAASRRIKAAIESGWLVNLSRVRNATKLLPGEPLPDGQALWPCWSDLNWTEEEAMTVPQRVRTEPSNDVMTPGSQHVKQKAASHWDKFRRHVSVLTRF